MKSSLRSLPHSPFEFLLYIPLIFALNPVYNNGKKKNTIEDNDYCETEFNGNEDVWLEFQDGTKLEIKLLNQKLM